ncbi:MAG TPA: hypothetical protein VG649_25385 [Candidatus Angelobacter sp.]|nr:hypothetical protein [Candidatus Angelobacter sp.]
MSLRDWVVNGWLTEHRSSAEEIRNLLNLVDRDLRTSQVKELDTDWKFAIAYNAALQAASAALAASGHRAAREAHHYRVIESLEFTIEADTKIIRKFDAFRKKRNLLSYELGGTISEKEAEEMQALAMTLRFQVDRWIREKYPELVHE